jgi:hypothetical protein
VKITLVPEQIVVALAAMLTEGTTVGLTVMVMVLDVAVGCVTQVNDEVITTETWSPLANVEF